MHQHFFDMNSGGDTLNVGAGDTLDSYVWLDPANPPREIMLQWNVGGSWEHRAYWGEDLMQFGACTSMGELPSTDGWTRLEVPASAVGLAGQNVIGRAFTIYDGRAWWDAAGKRASGASTDTRWVDDTLPPGATAHVTNDTWTWVSGNIDTNLAFTGHYLHARTGLLLAPFRAYDTRFARQVSRDPLENAEIRQGPNLYGYAGNFGSSATIVYRGCPFASGTAQDCGPHSERTRPTASELR